MKTLYRQGDVLLVSVEELPEDALEEAVKDRLVLAHGEVTGHAHVIDPAMAKAFRSNQDRYLEVQSGAALCHEEHATLKLKPGFYKIVIQREYSPGEPRRVLD
ncbi:MAG: hypothetical protein QG574_1731 [Cyanobacteriota bacterium erpe_2018_sw_21hr_WHONDRS-SW48-000092_B_bin.40]|jgi:hypothetical protein|nr:hypothetical protein [Cyanobacteriota bacterium erpe_2018_sw_21hr_WHONDRS-SW48-000092_B_bin.40]